MGPIRVGGEKNQKETSQTNGLLSLWPVFLYKGYKCECVRFTSDRVPGSIYSL